ncbi:DUF1264-domain-containing protein [Mollisia scopiformis]|uniref:DUF1264-domain-containing protein n=1 Tax=Mollisia scopiformis TaxID=149040 RepID=A0A194XGV2_MOLSC|nr:DUF1264-domain-containing protein [Mollisia scopiformis]KUJ19359.1 DUF1264-domain-containing protein [Mollisia scopiformis]
MQITFASLVSVLGVFAPFSFAALPFGNIGPEGSVLFLNGFHFLSGNASAEISANHYCTILSDDFLQCTVYTTGTTPEHLAGIEYIISPTLFATLSFEERQLWHSHAYEVTSGFLIEPHMPASVDLAIMGDVLVGTYGKTAHTWRFDAVNKTVPEGIPELVMGYTQDGQITPDFVTQRDELFEVNSTEIREQRANITAPPILPGADSWQLGFVLTYGLVNTTNDTVFPSSG